MQVSRKFHCPYDGCARSFAKLDHSERHQRRHTGAKPFACSMCGKTFGRHDSLSRHKKIHTVIPNLTADSLSDSSAPLSNHRNPTSEKPLEATHQSPLQTEAEVSPVAPSVNGNVMPTLPQIANGIEQSASLENLVSNLDQGVDHSGFSNDFLQLLMADTTNSWPLSLPVFQLPSSTSDVPDRRDETSETSREAVNSLSELIRAVPAKVTEEVNSNAISSRFFDDCLDLYFQRVSPVLPLLHRPTFSINDCSPALILNIIALGSLFVGGSEAVEKGESLWRLAYAVVATNWQTLLKQRGPRDRYDGVQLLATALLGQMYALLSCNDDLRLTSQMFHGLGFSWARHCGMYDVRQTRLEDIPSLESPMEVKLQCWKSWAASELQLRALLGHYILDGQIAQSSANPTCVRHTTNPLTPPASAASFSAKTVDEWIVHMHNENYGQSSFRDIMYSLFYTLEPAVQTVPLSAFAVQIVLEGIQSLVTENSTAGGFFIGSPSKSNLRSALYRIYDDHIMQLTNNLGLRLRWHAINIDLAMGTTLLCKKISDFLGVDQSLSGTKELPVEMRAMDLGIWTSSTRFRNAVLHAAAIHDILQNLPAFQACEIHVPSSILSAATIYMALNLTGTTHLTLPPAINWQISCCSSDRISNTETYKVDSLETLLFLRGNYSPENPSLGRRVFSELHSLRINLRTAASSWGVSRRIESMIDQWSAKQHTEF